MIVEAHHATAERSVTSVDLKVLPFNSQLLILLLILSVYERSEWTERSVTVFDLDSTGATTGGCCSGARGRGSARVL